MNTRRPVQGFLFEPPAPRRRDDESAPVRKRSRKSVARSGSAAGDAPAHAKKPGAGHAKSTGRIAPPRLPAALPYIGRELSWLKFNERVLEEARDARWPLLERLKFLCISETNLDEFFMIRVAGLRDQVESGSGGRGDDGLTATETLAAIRESVLAMELEQTRSLMGEILPGLAGEGIRILGWGDLTKEQQAKASDFFRQHVLPVLTPLAVDPGHPFPFLSNLSLNLAIEVRNPDTGEARFARVKLPPALPRLLSLREVLEGKKKVRAEKADFLLLESLVMANLGQLFPGLEILSSHLFRITRDADIEIQEDEASDLLATVEQEVRQRRFGAVVRVEVAPKTPRKVRKLLVRQLEVGEEDVYEVHGPLGAGDFFSLTKLDRKELKDPPFTPAPPSELVDPDLTVFDVVRQKDLLLHHPYDSFSTVVDLVSRAASDPAVLAIKMTLYRTSADSPLLPALIRAAEMGKQVAVLVELKARFDEENNIVWARALERAGVHVVYGVVGLKTHGKIALIVRREKDGIRRYVHLGTGNYNPTTARIYTDFGLLTSREEFGEDATRLFNSLTGFAGKPEFARIVTAPRDLHRSVLDWIARETGHALARRPAAIKAKMNALVDERVIAALYRAAASGVQVDLVVRGICCLDPGLPAAGGRIRVVSIVGRFLEHSRVFVFENGGEPEVWLSSADWMPRNFFRRVEIAFPLVDQELARRIREDYFDAWLRDTVQARVLKPGGTYERRKPSKGEKPWDSQARFLEEARRRWQRAVQAFERGGAADPDDVPQSNRN